MPVKHFLSIGDLKNRELLAMLEAAKRSGHERQNGLLKGKSIALLFEKPSLRTRASFQVAVHQLGGFSFYMGPDEVGMGKREPVRDVAKVLSGYVDCIIARVFSHGTLEELSKYSEVPVINALSDWEHPCQGLADLLTIHEEKGRLKGLILAYVGDGNNVARSLAIGSALTGINFRIASPPGYRLDESTLLNCNKLGAVWGVKPVECINPSDAVSNADVVYTDVWTSMGQEAESQRRREAFQGYTIDGALLSMAQEDSILMHPMPIHYGEEIAAGLLDHPRSAIYKQAENRLHAQKALLELFLASQ